MTPLYLDSSALVKGYLDEDGSDEVADLLAADVIAGTSRVAFVEIASALARAASRQLLSDDRHLVLLTRLEREWPRLFELEVSQQLIRRAAACCRTYKLRAYDAVHLASGLEWQDEAGEPVVFATFDRSLWQAAKLAGLTPWPGELR